MSLRRSILVVAFSRALSVGLTWRSDGPHGHRPPFGAWTSTGKVTFLAEGLVAPVQRGGVMPLPCFAVHLKSPRQLFVASFKMGERRADESRGGHARLEG